MQLGTNEGANWPQIAAREGDFFNIATGGEGLSGVRSLISNNLRNCGTHPTDCSGVVQQDLRSIGSGRYTLSL